MVWGGGASAITHAGPPVTADGSYSAGNLVYDSSDVLWLCVATGTPGTWAQVGAPAAASAVFKPADPANTASVTLVMMGLGSTVQYTPETSGIILVTASVMAQTLTAFTPMTVAGRYGLVSGGVPAHGAAVSGTRFGGGGTPSDIITGSVTVPVSTVLLDRLTLTPGAAYWFDIALSTNTAADHAEITNSQFLLQEAAV